MQNSFAEPDFSQLRVAIVHYWLVGQGGGEKVVEALASLFPQATLYTLVADPATLSPALASHTLHTSFLQRFPFAARLHRHLLPLQPLALEQFDLSGYDLVLSSESGPAKGVLTSARTCHICYCHSPMRYIWEMQSEYLDGMGSFTGVIFRLASHYLRQWDFASAARVDYFVANSRFVQSRIRKYYRRDSAVIHPPVETTHASLSDTRGDYYLAAGRLVGYKRFDLAIEACNRLNRRLRIIGSGPQLKALRRLAGPTIEFLGTVSDELLHRELAGCRALLFPGEEDFGILPVEAQSHGRPVIAYASGGALETVRGTDACDTVADATGLFFRRPTRDSLEDAILDFEACEARFNPRVIRAHSLSFSRQRFDSEMTAFIHAALREFRGPQPRPFDPPPIPSIHLAHRSRPHTHYHQ